MLERAKALALRAKVTGTTSKPKPTTKPRKNKTFRKAEQHRQVMEAATIPFASDAAAAAPAKLRPTTKPADFDAMLAAHLQSKKAKSASAAVASAVPAAPSAAAAARPPPASGPALL